MKPYLPHIMGTAKRQIKKCSCGRKDGWCEHLVHSGLQYYDENGFVLSWEGTTTRGGKRKYCMQCDRDITRLVRDN